MAKKLGTTPCPQCGLVDVVDPNRFVIIYPQGLGLAHAQATCESCGLVYVTSLKYEHARKFDEMGCPVRGFSFARGPKLKESEIKKFIENIDERMNLFLDGVYEEMD